MGNNITVESERKKMKKVMRRIAIARRWKEEEGLKVKKKLLDFGWQWRHCKRRWDLKEKEE